MHARTATTILQSYPWSGRQVIHYTGPPNLGASLQLYSIALLISLFVQTSIVIYIHMFGFHLFTFV